MPASDLKGLIAWLKANPNKATQANAGFGGPSHVAGLLFQKETATNFQFVPYRGAGPAMLDLVSGHIDLMITTEGLPQIRLGTIKAYAVMAKTRFSAAPDIPTIDEADCRDCMPRYGMLSGCLNGHQRTLSTSSMGLS
jgi:tripartite-type tricarboxylate transporter receptor subunit TctC